MARQPLGGLDRLIVRGFTITHFFRHTTLGKTPLDEGSDNTQHSQETDIHTPGANRTHDSSKRAAEDSSLRPHGHWDRPSLASTGIKNVQGYTYIVADVLIHDLLN
jgi:hypothetical protein